MLLSRWSHVSDSLRTLAAALSHSARICLRQTTSNITRYFKSTTPVILPLLFSLSLAAQVPSGIPQFGTFEKGSIDTVNLANLNVHIAIPVRNTPGRGLPFSAVLAQDTAIYYPLFNTSNRTWSWNLSCCTDPNWPNSWTFFALRSSVNYGTPVPLSVIRTACTLPGYSATADDLLQNGNVVTVEGTGFGIFTAGDIVTLSQFKNNPTLNGLFVTLLSATSTEITFYGSVSKPGGDSGTVTRATDYWGVGGYQDLNNTVHVGAAGTIDSVGCITGHTSESGLGYDGYLTSAAITTNAQQSQDSILVTVTTPGGVVLSSGQYFNSVGDSGGGNPSPGNTTTTTTDANGNTLSVTDNLGYTYVDSTGNTTTPVLTGGSGQFSYTGPNATSEPISTTYTSLVLQTNFGCSSVTEAGNGQKSNFPTKITLPDGSFYTISYEPTPGAPSNTTGRVQSITLPTGGTISYNYNGPNHGVSCQDGGTSGFTRTTPDGTWTYTRSYNSTTSMWTTTVFDPQRQRDSLHFFRSAGRGLESGLFRRVHKTDVRGTAKDVSAHKQYTSADADTCNMLQQ